MAAWTVAEKQKQRNRNDENQRLRATGNWRPHLRWIIKGRPTLRPQLSAGLAEMTRLTSLVSAEIINPNGSFSRRVILTLNGYLGGSESISGKK